MSPKTSECPVVYTPLIPSAIDRRKVRRLYSGARMFVVMKPLRGLLCKGHNRHYNFDVGDHFWVTAYISLAKGNLCTLYNVPIGGDTERISSRREDLLLEPWICASHCIPKALQ